METMNDYTVYCTKKQTRRAYKLGAPIEKHLSIHPGVKSVQIRLKNKDSFYATIPTTQQMIEWLRKKKRIDLWVSYRYKDRYGVMINGFINSYEFSYEQAEFAAIDAALDYLEKGE